MSPEKAGFRFGGLGKVYSYTTIYDPPAGFEEQTPYTVGTIQLDEGPRLTAQLTDLEKRKVTIIENGEERVALEPIVYIGMPVEMVTRILRKDEYGIIYYGYKFRPAGEIPNYNPNP